MVKYNKGDILEISPRDIVREKYKTTREVYTSIIGKPLEVVSEYDSERHTDIAVIYYMLKGKREPRWLLISKLIVRRKIKLKDIIKECKKSL